MCKITVEEVYKSDISHRARAVWLYLHQRANKEHSCFPSIATICSDVKLSKSTVKRAISYLVKADYIRKESRYRENNGQSSNLYTLI